MRCRFCGQELSLSFLDLGSAPPSNSYLNEDDLNAPETWYPLRIMVCEKCWLVQTDDFTGRENLFHKNYAYFSSYSTSWLSHAEKYVVDMIERFGLSEKSMVVEVAANDGYLLQYVQKAGVPCYGVEPTTCTANAAREKGIDIIEEFFDLGLATELAKKGQLPDLMIANNVLAHVPDINSFVSGFTFFLKPDGVVTFEFPHLLSMVRKKQFDTAYHEHYSYLSCNTVVNILKKNGLEVFDVQELPTHGGSLRVFAQRDDVHARKKASSVARMLKKEHDAGMLSNGFYKTLQSDAEAIKNGLLEILLKAKRQGLKVGAYGAAAKGNTLLNFAGVRPDLLPYVVDRNPSKQGKFMPGSRIPIVAEKYIANHKPDLILILPWNLQHEIRAQLDYVSRWGCEIIVPSNKYLNYD